MRPEEKVSWQELAAHTQRSSVSPWPCTPATQWVTPGWISDFQYANTDSQSAMHGRKQGTHLWISPHPLLEFKRHVGAFGNPRMTAILGLLWVCGSHSTQGPVDYTNTCLICTGLISVIQRSPTVRYRGQEIQ